MKKKIGIIIGILAVIVVMLFPFSDGIKVKITYDSKHETEKSTLYFDVGKGFQEQVKNRKKKRI